MARTIAWDKITYIAAGILLLLLIVNFVTLAGLSKNLGEQIADAKEEAKPAIIELMVLTTPTCENCYDISAVVSAFLQLSSTAHAAQGQSPRATYAQKAAASKLPSIFIWFVLYSHRFPG